MHVRPGRRTGEASKHQRAVERQRGMTDKERIEEEKEERLHWVFQAVRWQQMLLDSSETYTHLCCLAQVCEWDRQKEHQCVHVHADRHVPVYLQWGYRNTFYEDCKGPWWWRAACWLKQNGWQGWVNTFLLVLRPTRQQTCLKSNFPNKYVVLHMAARNVKECLSHRCSIGERLKPMANRWVRKCWFEFSFQKMTNYYWY